MAQAIFAARKRLATRQQLDQCRLPRPVHAHQRDPVAALDDEIHAAENELVPVALRHTVKLCDDAAARFGLRKRKVDGLLVVGQFDALNLFQLLDAALHLFRFRGLCNESG